LRSPDRVVATTENGTRGTNGQRLSVGLIGDGALVDEVERALADTGIELVRIGSADGRARLGRGLGVLVVSGGAASARRVSSIRRLCERASGVAVVVIVESIDDGVARAMIAAGARGVVLRGELDQTLAPTVRAARTGQISIPRPGRRQIFPPALSHRESAVLAKVALGQTNAEIAESLFLAESTVKSHLRSVFAKLGVNSRDEAAAAAGASLPPGGSDPGPSDF
jgi:DNA-binding NarL/FixJ family response regulator